MKLTLAEALLYRKDLNNIVERRQQLKNTDVYETRVQRMKVTDSLEDVTVNVPKLSASQVQAEADYYSRALRVLDAAIQKTNWDTVIDVPDYTVAPYSATVKESA